MLKIFSAAVLTVLLSTTASAQTKKRAAKKKAPAKPKVEQTLPETAPVVTEEAVATPEPVAAPVEASTPAVAGSGTEFNRQPNAGGSDFTLELGYTMAGKADVKNLAGVKQYDTEDSGFVVGLMYDYGFTANNSLGVATDFGTVTTKDSAAGVSTDSKETGMGDIFITSKNRSPMDGWNLNYGAALGIGAKKKFASTAPASDGNRASGGMSLPIYVGGEWQMGSGWLGARLDYGFLMERAVDSAGDPKLTGGNPMTVKLFWESTSWNVYGGFTSVGETTVKIGTAEGKTPAYSGTLLGASWFTHLAPTTQLGLNYDLTMWGERDQGTTKVAAQMQHDIGASFRFEF